MGLDIDGEFDRQRDVLLDKGYSTLAGLGRGDLAALIEPLRAVVRSAAPILRAPAPPSYVPFVLVVSPGLVRAEDIITLTSLAGRTAPGVVDRNHGDDDLACYVPLPQLHVPQAPVYVTLEIERGEEFCGIRPQEALPTIFIRGRTPLTIHEGIALITQVPAVLEKNRCFMLSGSRRGDRRVPALWISGNAPKLGWCWDGNPHSWLGTASAGARAT